MKAFFRTHKRVLITDEEAQEALFFDTIFIEFTKYHTDLKDAVL